MNSDCYHFECEIQSEGFLIISAIPAWSKAVEGLDSFRQRIMTTESYTFLKAIDEAVIWPCEES